MCRGVLELDGTLSTSWTAAGSRDRLRASVMLRSLMRACPPLIDCRCDRRDLCQCPSFPQLCLLCVCFSPCSPLAMSTWANNDLVDRMVGTLKIKVLKAYHLKDVAVFGTQNPQVSISVNGNKEYTSTKDDAGCQAEWNETLTFNLDCQPDDLVHVKVKHDRIGQAGGHAWEAMLHHWRWAFRCSCAAVRVCACVCVCLRVSRGRIYRCVFPAGVRLHRASQPHNQDGAGGREDLRADQGHRGVDSLL